MNARLYDPVVGRFLSPDPYVQAPFMSQNFNRYSYGLNNPLRYTDPNGEFWQYIAGAVIGGTINIIMNWDAITNEGFHFDKLASYAVLGAAGGLAIASGNFYLGLAAFTVQGGGNQFVRDNYNLSINVGTQAFVSGATFFATAGLTSGLPGGKGLGLDKIIGNQIAKIGISNYSAGMMGEYVVNFGVNFSSDATNAVIEGRFSWSKSLENAFWSSTMTLGINLAKDQYYFQMETKTETIANQADKAIQDARSSSSINKTDVLTPQNQKPNVPKQTLPNKGTKSNPYNSKDFWNRLNRRE